MCVCVCVCFACENTPHLISGDIARAPEGGLEVPIEWSITGIDDSNLEAGLS